MIQRKQTLYLLISGILLALLPFVSSGRIVSDQIYPFLTSGLEDTEGTIVQPAWTLFGLNIGIALISFVTIFLYRNRRIQMRLTVFNLLLKIGLIALGAFYLYTFKGLLGPDASLMVTPWTSLPVIAIIFDYLAHRSIAIDEHLVKYMNRLR